MLFSYIDPSDFSQVGFYTSSTRAPASSRASGSRCRPWWPRSRTAWPFYTSVSAEQADRFADVDVFVTYGDASGSIIPQLQADPLLSQIPAIAEGRIAILEESTPLAASANPSPLSIGWGIDEYFALLADALG